MYNKIQTKITELSFGATPTPGGRFELLRVVTAFLKLKV